MVRARVLCLLLAGAIGCSTEPSQPQPATGAAGEGVAGAAGEGVTGAAGEGVAGEGVAGEGVAGAPSPPAPAPRPDPPRAPIPPPPKPNPEPAPTVPPKLSQIPSPALPSVETDSFTPSGSITDIADDSAIYANPKSPELSVVIAGDKDDREGGVGVFDMRGKLLSFRQEGKIGNVDLRADFPFAGREIVLVAANNRTTDTLIFWELDPSTRMLSAPIGDMTRTTSPNYGLCLYHSEKTGKFYAFVTQETGHSVMEQYELSERAGKLAATKVRSFEVGSITEGCVADDQLGRLYVAQEDEAVWVYDPEPTGGATRTAIAKVGDGHVVDDLEGIALAKGPDNSGYLVVSIQSENRFAIYDRETNLYLHDFRVAANGSIDAVTQTDGLDISTSDLGPGFTAGALVVHDGSNSGGRSSNLKFVPLE